MSKDKSVVISARVGTCTLATLARFYYKEGVPLKSKSGLVSTSLSSLSKLLISNDCVSQIETPEEALNVLRNLGLIGNIDVDLSGVHLNSEGMNGLVKEAMEKFEVDKKKE